LQQNYAQALQQQNMPLEQLGAFQRATQPGYVNSYNQGAVAGPDYLGATATSNAAAIAQQNANLARQNATTQGLYGLGSAALLGAGGAGNLLGGAGNLISGAGKAGSGLLDLGKDAYYGIYDYFNPTSYIGPDFGTNPAFDNSVFDYLSFD
jgi:hypothetical protein